MTLLVVLVVVLASVVLLRLVTGRGRVIETSDAVVVVSERPSGGMHAMGGGPITIVGGCLGVGGDVVVWPHGTTVVEGDPLAVRVPGNGVVRVGDQVEIGGGYVREHSSDVVAAGPFTVAGATLPASCAAHDVFLAS